MGADFVTAALGLQLILAGVRDKANSLYFTLRLHHPVTGSPHV
jgi:hypothetical protein